MEDNALKDHTLEQVLDTPNFKAFYLRPPGGGRMMSTLIVFTPEGIVLMGDLTPGHHGNVSALGYGLSWFAGDLSGSYLCEKFLQKSWHAELAKEWCLDMAKDARCGRLDHEGDFDVDGLEVAADDREAAHDELASLRKDLKDAIGRADAADVDEIRKAIAAAKGGLSPYRGKLVERRESVAANFEEICQDDDSVADCSRFRDALEKVFPEMDFSGVSGGFGYRPAEKAWLCAIQKRFAELYNAMAPAPAQ